VSHLPHLLAFALMHAIVNQPQGKDILALAGPGFRDFSRIAASDPKMWRDVLLANRHELVEQAKMFQRSLLNMLQLAEEGNGEKLEEMISQASTTRAHWRMGHKAK
jgi:prephenate dehydrogenase